MNTNKLSDLYPESTLLWVPRRQSVSRALFPPPEPLLSAASSTRSFKGLHGTTRGFYQKTREPHEYSAGPLCQSRNRICWDQQKSLLCNNRTQDQSGCSVQYAGIMGRSPSPSVFIPLNSSPTHAHLNAENASPESNPPTRLHVYRLRLVDPDVRILTFPPRMSGYRGWRHLIGAIQV